VRVDGDAQDPVIATGDITRLVTTHSGRAVVAEIRFRRYPAAGQRLTTLDIRTSARRRLEAFSFRGRALLVDLKNNPVECPDLEWHPDPDADLVRYVVPRRCLGDPAWVQTRAGFVGHLRGTGGLADEVRWGPRIS
jgi:hypothetical protein